jgi:NDP-sugar pyrophosphorylase family protein
VGHTSELKSALLLNSAKAAHFAYVGDSILGIDCNLGAGTKCANLRLDHGLVPLRFADTVASSGLKKFGAVFGNRAQTGCNAVTNPGTLLLPHAILLPNTTGQGAIAPRKAFKPRDAHP